MGLPSPLSEHPAPFLSVLCHSSAWSTTWLRTGAALSPTHHLCVEVWPHGEWNSALECKMTTSAPGICAASNGLPAYGVRAYIYSFLENVLEKEKN